MLCYSEVCISTVKQNMLYYTAVQNKCTSNLAGSREPSVGKVTQTPSFTSVLLDVVTSGVSLTDTGSDSRLDDGKASAPGLFPR